MDEGLISLERELNRCDPAVLASFQAALSEVPAHFSPPQVRAWAQEGVAIAQLSRPSAEAAMAYFQVASQVFPLLSFDALLAWARQGRDLIQDAPRLAAAYFEASGPILQVIPPQRLESWQGLGRRLFHVSNGSLALATLFFQVSPQLFRALSVDELDHFVILLRESAQGSPEIAAGVLRLAAETLDRIDARARQSFLSLIIDLTEKSLEGIGGGWHQEQVPSSPQGPNPLRGSGLGLASGRETPDELLRPLAAGTKSLAQQDPQRQGEVLRRAEAIARASARAAIAFLKSSPTLVASLDASGLESWCQEGQALLKDSPERGTSYFALQSAEARAALSRVYGGIELQDVREVLRLYTKALTGRSLQVLSTEELARKNIGWVAGERPTTDGAAIYAPPRVEDFGTYRENFSCYKVGVAHQAAHLEFGTFDFDLERDGAVFANLRRYFGQAAGLSQETKALASFERFFDLFEDRPLAADLFTVAEDARVDHRLLGEYRGIRRSYRQVQQHCLQERSPLWSLPLRQAVVDLLIRLSVSEERIVQVPSPLAHAVRTAVGILKLLQDPAATVEDAAEATLRLYIGIRHIPNVDAGVLAGLEWEDLDLDSARYPAATEDVASVLALFRKVNEEGHLEWFPGMDPSAVQSPYEGVPTPRYRGELKPELVQTLLALREGEDLRDETLSAELPRLAEALRNLLEKSTEIRLQPAVGVNPATLAARFVRNLLAEAGKGRHEDLKDVPQQRRRRSQADQPRSTTVPTEIFDYDEWDFRAKQYRPNWCRVHQRQGEEGSLDFFEETLKGFPGLVSDIKRQFELLRAERLRKQKRLLNGEEFDLDAVVEAMVEKQAGRTPSEKIYWRRSKNERDVAVAVLLDMSISTDERIDPSISPFTTVDQLTAWRGKRIIDLEKESLVLLTWAMELIGDRYGLYGFSGQGRDHVEFIVIKEIDETLNDIVKRRIDRIAPIHGTRMGTAIRHTITKLEEQEARTKVLILFSDGRPQDRDYGRDAQQIQHLMRELVGPLALMRLDAMRIEEIADRREKEYAVHDTHMALLEARQKRIIPFCISVDKAGHDYLRTMCGDIGYEVVSDLNALPKRLASLYRKLTT